MSFIVCPPIYYLVKVCFLVCRLLGEKHVFRYIGKTISVNVLNKSRGFEMHWVGGGGKCPQRDNSPHIMFELVCVNVVDLCFSFLRK